MARHGRQKGGLALLDARRFGKVLVVNPDRTDFSLLKDIPHRCRGATFDRLRSSPLCPDICCELIFPRHQQFFPSVYTRPAPASFRRYEQLYLPFWTPWLCDVTGTAT